MAIKLLIGKIMHKRFLPRTNQFNYHSIYIGFSLAEKLQLKKKLFSVNKPNIYSFYDCDHGRKESNCESWIKEILRQQKIDNVAEIFLVTHPRIFFYVFNPVSFWLCFDKEKNLIAVLSEVNNTFGQRHSYLIFNQNQAPIHSDQWFESDKAFHVSPFFSLNGIYKFRFDVSENKFNFYINYFVDNKLQLCTYLKCETKEFSDWNLLIYFLKIPFATFKTIVLIHFQALKLFFKKIKFYPLITKPKTEFSLNKNDQK